MARLTKDDLTDENRALIAAAAQKELDAQPHTAFRPVKVKLADGREVELTSVSAVDPIITDGNHVIMIQKGSERYLLPGGMVDWDIYNVVEIHPETAEREQFEETSYVLQPGDKVTVLGTPKVNPRDIRFFDPNLPHADELARKYGFKEGDPFIMDSVPVMVMTKTDLSKMVIAEKGVPLSELPKEQIQADTEGMLLQAGDDARTVNVLAIKDFPELIKQGKIWEAGAHYAMLHMALPDKIPAYNPEPIQQLQTTKAILGPQTQIKGAITMTEQHMMPILSDAKLADIIIDHFNAVPVVKAGLVPIATPKSERIAELANGRTVFGVTFVNNSGKEKTTEGAPYCASINPALEGTGETANLVFNGNPQADLQKFASIYDVKGFTYDEAIAQQQQKVTVQGDPNIVNAVLQNRAFLVVTNADGTKEKIALAPSDFTVTWHPAQPENVRHVLQIEAGYHALLPKVKWTDVQTVEAPGLIVANGRGDAYRDEAGGDARVSLLTCQYDGSKIPELIEIQDVDTLKRRDFAHAEYTASEFKNLSEKELGLIQAKIGTLKENEKAAVRNWLKSIDAEAFGFKVGLEEPMPPDQKSKKAIVSEGYKVG